MRPHHLVARVAFGAVLVTAVAPAARAQGTGRACGVERWAVKVAIDDDAARIDTAVMRTTVDALGRLPRPSLLPPRGRARPYEVRTYRVIGVLRAVVAEDDSDLHLVIEDVEQPGRTLVAEVPAPDCALGSPYASRFADLRRRVQAAPRDAIVILDGVGFFDFPHGQQGAAPNAFELHPVTGLRMVGVAAEYARQTGQPGQRDTTADSTRGSTVKVWVNTASHVYHCPGTRWYGATQRGVYMTEHEALAIGARPAGGRECVRPGDRKR